MKQMFIGERGTNEKYRSLSNFLENFRQIALFVLIRIYRMGEVYALRDQRVGASP